MRKSFFSWYTWPKGTVVLLTELVIRCFGYFFARTVLVLFLKRVLGFTENGATTVFHSYLWFACFTPIIGAVIADSKIGKWKTIVYASGVLVVGTGLLTSSAIPGLGTGAVYLGMLGLLFLAFGAGGNSCGSPFAGDQFKLPEEADKLKRYYSFGYWLANAMVFLSIFIAPKVREIQCYGGDCYLLNFSLATTLYFLATCLYIAGKSWFVIKPPEENVVAKVFHCMTHAYSEKGKWEGKVKSHWLDYAEAKYGVQLIKDIKQLLGLCVLFVPLPLYWALFEQQSSRWTFQATRMTGDLPNGWQIAPDQTQLLNPLFVLILIPIFDYIIYPVLDKLNVLKKPLQRMTLGGFLAAAAFVISAILEHQIQNQYPQAVASSHSTMHFVNTAPCPLRVELLQKLENASTSSAGSFELQQNISNTTVPFGIYDMKIVPVSGNCGEVKTFPDITAPSGMGVIHAISMMNNALTLTSSLPQNMTKSSNGTATVIVFYTDSDTRDTVIEFEGPKVVKANLLSNGTKSGITSGYSFQPHRYSVTLKTTHTKLGDFYPRMEGLYLLTIVNRTMTEYTLIEPNHVHMLWIIPQYLAITISEVLFSVTSINFIYSQAPESLKAVVQAAWLLATAFGNLFVLVIAQANFFHNDVSREFYLFAALMAATMVIFAVLAWQFKPVEITENAKDEKDNMELATSLN